MSGDCLGARSRESALSAFQAKQRSDMAHGKTCDTERKRSYPYLYWICRYSVHSFIDMRFDNLAMQLP